MDKLKIFVSAYACEPNHGSEIGVGWNWVLEMSKYFDLWVLTRKSNKHTIETWISENPDYQHINFIYFDLPYYLRFWKSGRRGVRIYYNIWQFVTNHIVKETMMHNNIKIFHHLTYGNVLWSVSSYGKKQFFVWGPAGGVETIESDFSKHYHAKGRLIEWVRRIVSNSLKYNFGFNNRCKNANLILCKTEILKNTIPKKYRDKAILFTDVAVDMLKIENHSYEKQDKKTNYIITGNLDPWRGFDVLIEAFDLAVKVNPNIHLNIIGKGMDKTRLQDLIVEKKLGKNIDMLGKVSMDEYMYHMKNSDVVVNTSLKEGAVTTAFDSMAMGIPLICVDTTGYTRYFSNDYALVIPMKKREELIVLLKEAILKLTDIDTRRDMGKNAQNAGKSFTWESRGLEIHKVITEAYNKSDEK